MRLNEAERFYEEDEDPAEVFAEFDAAEKDRTMPPADHRREKILIWMLDHVAAVLRHMADIIESSHTRAR